MSLSLLTDLRDLKRAFADLFTPSPEDEDASYQLAVSARRFSKRAKAAAEDKLTFSATLMRAGEVDAANRLLAEFERDVRDEEVALIECVNEVKAAGAVRKQFALRRRAAGLAAVGLVGSSILGVSAASMAAVSMFKDRAGSAIHSHLAEGSANAGRAGNHATRAASAGTAVRKVKIAGVNVTLRGDQIAAFNALSDGAVQSNEIQKLLVLLPDAVAAKVQKAIDVVTTAVASPPVPSEVAVRIKKIKKETRPKQRDSAEPSPSPQQDSGQSSSSDGSHKSGHQSDGSGSGGGDGQGDNIPVPPLPSGSQQN